MTHRRSIIHQEGHYIANSGLFSDYLLCSQRVRNAACSVGRAHASSKRLCVMIEFRPRIAANPSTVVLTMLCRGCCHVNETPEVWVWNLMSIDLSFFRMVLLLDHSSPDPPCRAELRYLLKEVHATVEEE